MGENFVSVHELTRKDVVVVAGGEQLPNIRFSQPPMWRSFSGFHVPVTKSAIAFVSNTSE